MSLLMNESYKDLVLWVVEEKPEIEEIAAKLKTLVEAFEPSLIEALMIKLRAALISN